MRRWRSLRSLGGNDRRQRPCRSGYFYLVMPGAVEDFAGTRARMLAVVDHDVAVDDDEIDSIWGDIGMLVC